VQKRSTDRRIDPEGPLRRWRLLKIDLRDILGALNFRLLQQYPPTTEVGVFDHLAGEREKGPRHI